MNFFLKHSVVLVVQYLFCCAYVVVLFRVITVYPDLKPFTQEINVYISVGVFVHILSCGQFLPSDVYPSLCCRKIAVCLSVRMPVRHTPVLCLYG